jgi:hypothetical protein
MSIVVVVMASQCKRSASLEDSQDNYLLCHGKTMMCPIIEANLLNVGKP